MIKKLIGSLVTRKKGVVKRRISNKEETVDSECLETESSPSKQFRESIVLRPPDSYTKKIDNIDSTTEKLDDLEKRVLTSLLKIRMISKYLKEHHRISQRSAAATRKLRISERKKSLQPPPFLITEPSEDFFVSYQPKSRVVPIHADSRVSGPGPVDVDTCLFVSVVDEKRELCEFDGCYYCEECRPRISEKRVGPVDVDTALPLGTERVLDCAKTPN